MRTEHEAEEPGALASALAGVAVWCCRHPWLVAAAVLLSCCWSLVYTSRHVTFHTQRTDLLNKRKDYYQRWQQYLAEFGNDDDMVVIVQGDDRDRMRLAIDELAERIRRQPALFDRLFYRIDARALRQRGLLFLPTEQIRQIHDNLKNMAMLLEPPVLGALNSQFGWQMLTVLQLLNEGDRRANSLATDPVARPEQDPMLRQLNAICRSAVAALRDPDAYRNPWISILPEAPRHDALSEPQYFFSDDGRLAFLMVRPLPDDDSFTFARNSIESMRRILDELRPRFPGLGLGLTGLPVLENDEMIASQEDSRLASWLALAGVAILYLVVYRGWRYPFMTVAALVVGTVWALGWLTLTVGHLNILSSAFAVMLIGMGDYGVLWATRFGLERRAGADVIAATRRTAVHVGPSIVTAALTTALAFYAAMLADLKAVAELGWIAGSGVLLCAVSCIVLMPALLALLDRTPIHSGATIVLADACAARREWLPALTRRPRWVLAGSAVLTVALAVCASQIHYDHNILNIQAPRLDSVKWQHTLIQHAPSETWHAVTMTTTPEEALALKARYEALPTVSRVVEAASLVPRDQERKLEVLRDIQLRLRRLPQRGTLIEQAEPALPDVERAAQKLAQALERLDTTPLVGELRDHVRQLLDILQSSEADAAATRLQAFQQRLAGDLLADLHRLRDVSTPAPIQVADIPESLRERYVGQTGQWLLRVFAKDCLWEYGPLERFVNDVKAADPQACGRPFATLEGLKAMRDGFLWAGAYALAAMVLVLLLDFGSLKHTLVALLPLAMGMAAALGIMALCGVALNPANMIAFPLILGVGADNGVHVMHDYRDRRGVGRYVLSYATGRGIMVAALTTVLGFGTLMISQHRGMASLGLALTLGVSACMLTALVFLPALLNVISRRRVQATDQHMPISDMPMSMKKAA
ncbi:MAG: MMPL family transporter [Gemmataceae bacterium]|nr:MMPL family transporter [Gemmataceae bacterium]